MLTLACGGSYGGTSGNISSPNYPSNYGSNEDCCYIIESSNGKNITVTFFEFDTADLDFVMVGN